MQNIVEQRERTPEAEDLLLTPKIALEGLQSNPRRTERGKITLEGASKKRRLESFDSAFTFHASAQEDDERRDEAELSLQETLQEKRPSDEVRFGYRTELVTGTNQLG